MWQPESDCYLIILRFTTNEADWTDNDKIVWVMFQIHTSTNADINLYVLSCVPMLLWNLKEDLVTFTEEFAILFSQCVGFQRGDEVEIRRWFIRCVCALSRLLDRYYM